MWISSIQQCLHLHWEHPSLQQRLWLRHSKIHHTTQDLIRNFSPRLLTTSVRSVTKLLTADCSIRRTLVLTSRLYCTRYRAVCSPTWLPSWKNSTQKTNSTMFSRKFRVYVKTLVNRHLLLRLPRSLVHRLYSTYSWARDTKWLQKKQKISC